jgi:surface protein
LNVFVRYTFALGFIRSLLEQTFGGAAAFNQDISSWETSKVTNMAQVSNESMACCVAGSRFVLGLVGVQKVEAR